ncbi:unnamed protein product [Lepidochelys kempii]
MQLPSLPPLPRQEGNGRPDFQSSHPPHSTRHCEYKAGPAKARGQVENPGALRLCLSRARGRTLSQRCWGRAGRGSGWRLARLQLRRAARRLLKRLPTAQHTRPPAAMELEHRPSHGEGSLCRTSPG